MKCEKRFWAIRCSGVGLSAVLIIFILGVLMASVSDFTLFFGQQEWHLAFRKSCSGTDPDLEEMKVLVVGVMVVVDVMLMCVLMLVCSVLCVWITSLERRPMVISATVR